MDMGSIKVREIFEKDIQQKVDELMHMDGMELCRRILAFRDQHRLDFTDDGRERLHPASRMADRAQARIEADPGYAHSAGFVSRVKWAMADGFARSSCDYVEASAVQMLKQDIDGIRKGRLIDSGLVDVYAMEFRLVPEGSAVSVYADAQDGPVMVGELPGSYAEAHVIMEPMDARGVLVDEGWRVSCTVRLDTEEIGRTVSENHAADVWGHWHGWREGAALKGPGPHRRQCCQ